MISHLLPHQIIDTLEAAFRAPAEQDIKLCLVGPPGVGKTAWVGTAAQRVGLRMFYEHPGTQDPTDVAGFPALNATHTFANKVPFGTIKEALIYEGPAVLFLDDMGQGTPAVQAAYMPFLDRTGAHRLPLTCRIVAATNRRQDRANVMGMLEPIKSRFHSLIEVDPMNNPLGWAEDWARWALTQPWITAEDVAFIRIPKSSDGGTWLFEHNPTADMTNMPCPRTWAKAAHLLQLKLPEDHLRVLVAGAVGEAAMVDRFTFRELQKNLPQVELVIANPKKAPIPKQLGVLCTLAITLGMYANADNFGAVVAYAQRLVENGKGEFGTLMMRDAVRRDASLMKTADWYTLVNTTNPLQELLGNAGY